jgi:hypothetical protein
MLEQSTRPVFDGAPILKELVDRYQSEIGSADLNESVKSGSSSNGPGPTAEEGTI